MTTYFPANENVEFSFSIKTTRYLRFGNKEVECSFHNEWAVINLTLREKNASWKCRLICPVADWLTHVEQREEVYSFIVRNFPFPEKLTNESLPKMREFINENYEMVKNFEPKY